MSTEGLVPASGISQIPFLFLPDRHLFARRAKRLRFLSNDHPLGGYLSFLASLADAQQDALDRLPDLSLPGLDEQVRCREQNMPLLNSLSRSRDPAWRTALAAILQQMHGAAFPARARETISGLMRTGEASLERTADRIQAGDLNAVSPQELPFVAASLQVCYLQMASMMNKDAAGRLVREGLCPVCGSCPSIGLIRSGGPAHGLRYLSCSLCSSQWHMVRIKCSSCASTRRIDYHILEGSNGAIKAESCGDCNVYLKLLYLGKDPQMEATADDLSTLALDVLMDKEGKVRRGAKPVFSPRQRALISRLFHFFRREETLQTRSDHLPIFDFDILLSDSLKTHGHLCAGQVLGVRMSMLGLREIGILDPKGSDRKKILAYVEMDRCATDAVQSVTGCSLGRRTLKFMDYGKMAATFVNLATGKSVRIVALEEARQKAKEYFPGFENQYTAQREAYKVMSEHELFAVMDVQVKVRPEDMPGRPLKRVQCKSCGEYVQDMREVCRDGRVLCIACARGSYYEIKNFFRGVRYAEKP